MPYPTLGSFIPVLIPKLGGRTDINDQIRSWLVDAYREICMGFPLETLEVTTQNLTVAGLDTYDYPPDARALKALTIVSNNVPYTLRKMNIQVVRRYEVNNPGQPAIWAPFGRQFLIRANPNTAYVMIEDYWKIPTIDTTDADTIDATEIELPDDWFEILTYNALERGHQQLMEFDKAQAVHTQIHGDPNPSKGWPGILKERLTRNAAENVLGDFGLRPRIRPFGSSR